MTDLGPKRRSGSGSPQEIVESARARDPDSLYIFDSGPARKIAVVPPGGPCFGARTTAPRLQSSETPLGPLYCLAPCLHTTEQRKRPRYAWG